MLMPQERLIFCFAKVKEITASYKLLHPIGGNHTIRSVTLLQDAIAPTLNGSLDIRELAEKYIDGGPVMGFFLVNAKNEYTIVHLGLNTCWTRLVLAKELFHVLLDSEESRNINVAGHLDQFMTSLPDKQNPAAAAVVSEWEAEFAAVEFLFPFADRLIILGNDYKSAEIAERYMIPKVIVERYLSAEYMGALSRFFQQ